MKIISLWSIVTLVMSIQSQDQKQQQFKEQVDNNVRQHQYLSLEAPFTDPIDQGYFDFGGDTVVDRSRHIRLTHDKSSKAGFLWSSQTLPQHNWKVEFEFKVSGAGSTISGDGFAFWATQERMLPGPVFGSKDYFTGLGVFFDTYSNGYHSEITFPYLFAMIGDGATQYNLSEDGINQNIGNCSLSIRNKSYLTKAAVVYVKEKFLVVGIVDEENGQYRKCFVKNGVKLPDNLYLGFSALTGQLSDNHDIIKVTTFHSEVDPNAPEAMYQRDGPKRGAGTSFFGFLFKVALFAGVGYLIYMGYTNYVMKSKKRF